MTRDDIAPIGQDDPGFPCPKCGGCGTVHCGGVHVRCVECGGSGYGPPPPSLDQTKAHCLRRLAEWAHRARPTEEN